MSDIAETINCLFLIIRGLEDQLFTERQRSERLRKALEKIRDSYTGLAHRWSKEALEALTPDGGKP